MAKTRIENTNSKTVGDPNFKYESLKDLYARARAIVGGEHATKLHDSDLDVIAFTNILIPFSVTMTPPQYAFYRSEAELPGLCSQYLRVLVAGLLRKRPELVLPEDVDKEAQEWLLSDFSKDHGSLLAFLSESLEEEITTSRAWVGISHPYVDPDAQLTQKQMDALRPFPILYKAEAIINWKQGVHPVTGHSGLTMVVVRQSIEKPGNNEFHPDIVDTVWVHDLDELGEYRIRTYERNDTNDGTVEQGDYKSNIEVTHSNAFELVAVEKPMALGEHLTEITMYPLNGSVDADTPILMPLIDREAALYNKISRRNHLMYGAATFTPVIESDMTDEEVNAIAGAGLGAWLRVRAGEKISVLDTPTAALKDMDRAIDQSVQEIARMGIRMMAPDVRDQSGTALEIKNAHMTSQLSTLNVLISQTMRTVFAVMLNWKYGTDYDEHDIHFNLAPDFNPVPLGADWLRLITEWYDSGKIPRSTWLEILKANDVVPHDYDDRDAVQEIESDNLIAGTPTKEKELELDTFEEQQRILSNFYDGAEGSSNSSGGSSSSGNSSNDS